MAKKKVQKTDGLGPYEISKIRGAIRLVWQRSLARKIVVDRCTGFDGYSYCEKCLERAPKIFIDHILNVGDVDEGFIARLFCSSDKLQGLCKKCHDPKTKKEKAHTRALKKK